MANPKIGAGIKMLSGWKEALKSARFDLRACTLISLVLSITIWHRDIRRDT
jgi:hypothetical protein